MLLLRHILNMEFLERRFFFNTNFEFYITLYVCRIRSYKLYRQKVYTATIFLGKRIFMIGPEFMELRM